MSKTLTETDSEYWNNYYRQKVTTTSPSNFALFVQDRLKGSKVIMDIGCGNGRDSAYFIERGHTVIGVDASKEALDNANALTYNKIIPVVQDTSKMQITKSFIDVAYSRFSLHSMDRESYLKTIKNVSESLVEGGQFWIEVRSTQDELFQQGQFVDNTTYRTDHSRRFVRIQELVKDLVRLGLMISFADEQKGWAVHGNDDPVVIRVCAVK